jgi:amino acid transporter
VPSPHRPAQPGRFHEDNSCPPIRHTEEPATSHLTPTRDRLRKRLPVIAVLAVALAVVFAPPAYAATGAPTLTGVIDNLRNWLVGILATVATLFLTIGGLRYLTAGGDPGQVEKAKTALKSAAIGYAFAILAPLLVSILASVVGG